MKKNLFMSSLLIAALFGFGSVRAELNDHASPNYDRLIGQQELCYQPVYLGESDVSSERVLTVERKVREASNFQESVLIKVDMNGEPSNEIVISNLPGTGIHIAGAVALTEGLFALIGNGSSGAMLATADSLGKVVKAKTIGGLYQIKGISRVSSEQFLVYGAKSGKPFYALINRDLNFTKEQQVATKKSFGTVVKAEFDQADQSLIMVVQSTNDASFSNTDIGIHRSSLDGKISASYVVQGFLGDFVKTNDGIGLVYLSQENPRLCRGDSRSLTFTGVHLRHSNS